MKNLESFKNFALTQQQMKNTAGGKTLLECTKADGGPAYFYIDGTVTSSKIAERVDSFNSSPWGASNPVVGCSVPAGAS